MLQFCQLREEVNGMVVVPDDASLPGTEESSGIDFSQLALQRGVL
jgi:hypothetical protein